MSEATAGLLNKEEIQFLVNQQIDENSLEILLRQHGLIIASICHLMNVLRVEVQAQKQNVATVSSEIYIQQRQKLIEEGNQKPTEKFIENLVQSSQEVKNANITYFNTWREYEELSNIKTVAVAREFVFKQLIELYKSDYWHLKGQ